MIERPTGVKGKPPAARQVAGDGSPVATPRMSLAQEGRVARKEQLQLLRRSKTFVAGTVIVGVWLLFAIFGELIAPQDPLATDPLNDLAAPSAEHWFGTDLLGRDSFARVMSGGRSMLILAPSAALAATVLGTTFGLVSGYFRGAVDEVLGRIIDALLALPVVIFALLVLVAVGPSRVGIILAVGIPSAPIVARSVRAAVLAEREQEYIDAALVRSENAAHIMFREILPNVRAVVLVEFIMRLAYAVFAIAALGFIGVGVQPPTPDWGRQVLEHYHFLLGHSLLGAWAVLLPTVAIATLVVGFSLIADGLTEVVER